MSLRDEPKATNVARVLDFPGFYESVLSDALDDAETQMVEGLIDSYDLPAEANPHTACYDASKYSIGFKAITEAYVDWLNHVLDNTGIVLAFDSMESPREYNFTTDALFVTINDLALLVRRTDPAILEAVIKEQFTSRPGFISFYSNDIRDWRVKPLDKWDHNERGALITAYIRQRMEQEGVTNDDMLEWMQDDFNAAVDAQTDFTKLYATLGITP